MGTPPDTRADLAADTRAASRVSAGPDEVLVPGLTVLCHPDLGRVGERAPLPALDSGRAVALSRAEPLFAQPGAGPDAGPSTTGGRPLAEPHLSRTPLRLIPAGDSGITLDPVGSPTAVEAEGEPLAAPRTFHADELRRGGASSEVVGGSDSPEDRPEPRRPDDITDEELLAALEATRFRPYAAARRLGISRASIYDLMAKHPAIRTASDLGREEIEACRERCGGDLDAMAEELKVSPLGLRRRMGELGI